VVDVVELTAETGATHPASDVVVQGAKSEHTSVGVASVINERETGLMTTVLQFDGQTNYIEIAHSSALEIKNDFTVEAWFNAQTLEGYQRIFSKFPGFGAGLTGNGLIFTTYWIQDYLASTQLTPGVWYHLAIVFDTSNSALFYLDGELVQTIEGGVSVTASTKNLEIGRLTDGRGEYFNGQLAELRIWNKAQSQLAIQTRRSYRLFGNEPNLVGYWPLDEASETTAYDKTSNANHGNICGDIVWTSAPLELGAAVLHNEDELLSEQADAALTEDSAKAQDSAALNPAPVIIELESQSPQALEEFLTKCEGMLYNSVDEVVDQMKIQGTIARTATPVFVIVSPDAVMSPSPALKISS
jgi:hypothetical protein